MACYEQSGGICAYMKKPQFYKEKGKKMYVNRRTYLKTSAALGLSLLVPGFALAADFASVEATAKGQTVYFNAWAGADYINAYIAWVGEQVLTRYGVKLEHVKITDTAEVVKRVRDEVAAGKADGSVDLVWINGENFRAMKDGKLLFGPFANALPNFKFVDTTGKPTTLVDFQEPVDGLEAPWGMAQLTFFGDGAKVKNPPRSMAELVAFAKANHGRVAYPAPPDFHGTTFLKQVMLESGADATVLSKPVDAAGFAAVATPWLALLDELHQHSWRNGKQFPQNQGQVTQMLADGEVLIGITFNPNEPANLVAAGTLPASTIAWQHTKGTIGNTHFVAIPVNAKAKEGAQVVANFLMSAEAQARKNDLKVWGDPTVLAVARLSMEDAKLFGAADAPGSVSLPGPTVPELHATWVKEIETAWLGRYGKG
jgi:putative thiamine transport system substrate-binding protein